MLDAPAKENGGHASVIYYKVNDLQVVFETLSARGVVFESKPHMIAKMTDHELWMSFFRDPDKEPSCPHERSTMNCAKRHRALKIHLVPCERDAVG